MKNRANLQEVYREYTIRELIAEYEKKGYTTFREYKIGDYQIDLMMEKGEERIYFEIKSGISSRTEVSRMKSIAAFIKEHPKDKFEVVFAYPPQDKIIQIENIGDLFYDYFLNNMPSELDILSSHTFIDDVSDIEISEINVEADGTFQIKGVGSVGVELNYGSSSDEAAGDGSKLKDSYEFEFEAQVINKGPGHKQILNDVVVRIDTDSFYGERSSDV